LYHPYNLREDTSYAKEYMRQFHYKDSAKTIRIYWHIDMTRQPFSSWMTISENKEAESE